MASSTSQSQSTATHLASWLKETMKVPSAKKTDVKQLVNSFLPVCKGSTMATFWENMITHVRPVEEVDVIKKHIEMNDLRSRSEELVAELECKRRKLRALREERDSLSLQAQNKAEEVQFLNQQVRASQELRKNMRIKSQLYKSLSEVLGDQVTSCKAYLDWITELKDTYTSKRKSDGPFKNTVESAIHVLNEAIADGNCDRKHLFPIVGDLVKTYSPKMIVLALSKMTMDLMNGIQEEVERFNAESEIDQLQSKIESGSVSYGPHGGTTLKGMLVQWDSDCVKSYSEWIESERNYQEMMATVIDIRETIIESLKPEFEFEPSTLQLAINILDAEAELGASTTCLESLQSAKSYLQDEIKRKSKTQEDVLKLKEKILALSKIIRQDQEKIIRMTKGNSSVAMSLGDRQSDVQSVGLDLVCSQKSDIKKCCENARSVFQTHLTAFNHVDMDRLRQVEMPEGLCPIKELSIHRYNDISEQKGKFSYQRSICRLSLHGHVPPSVVLHKILEMKSKITRLDKFKTMIDELETADSVKQLESVQKRCIESERNLFDKLHPQYKKGVEAAGHAKEACSDVAKMIKIWSDQPAQYQTPWLTVCGMSFKDWKAKRRHTQ